jgi:hypothetical protein
MPLSLLLPPELEERLREEAARRGLPADVAVLQILDQHLPPAARRAAAVAMLREWAQEDEALTDEQLATNAAVLRDLDASRSSDRSLFSDILKDELR